MAKPAAPGRECRPMSGTTPRSVGPSDPCVMVIFGAGGDLTRRKLIPALCNLAAAGLLSRQFAIIGVSYHDLSTDALRAKLSEDIKTFATTPVAPEIWQRLVERIHYVQGDFHEPETYEKVREALAQVAAEHGIPPNYFYYLAVAPSFFGVIVRQLGAAGLTAEENGQWRRVIIEKPFGRDLDSARALNAEVTRVFNESQIYRIDHYLGKETVQNLLVFRFGNAIFEPIWNRRYVDHVQITAAETVGVEQRGGYYETAGALRDMVPTHLFQLLALVAMEPPTCFEADAVRDEQTKVLRAIQGFTPQDVFDRAVRGQYGEGKIDGQRVSGYRAERKVTSDSSVETFVALKILVDNWRWAGVPFYLRTGKRLPSHVSEIALQFQQAPFMMFRDTGVESLRTNRLVIQIQPDEGISLRFGAKIPGPLMQQGAVRMDFKYRDYFGSAPATGYERLLYDCMMGDSTLFRRVDMVEAGWRVVTPILDVWNAVPPRSFPNYAAGSWGPAEADELLARDGREWRQIEP
jgi:glucose-6-phosphate 1-dehydrogenase